MERALKDFFRTLALTILIIAAASAPAAALVEVLKRCGDKLTRENIMKVVANLDFEINTYIPGIRIKTSPTDFYPIEQVQMMRFSGENWQLFGPLIDGHAE